ncbi:hypothetical protein BGZ98_002869 [Dissophora globulifera]|nr:hypothetical protein BGZ98_002869 [Dissophora globulifera]
MNCNSLNITPDGHIDIPLSRSEFTSNLIPLDHGKGCQLEITPVGGEKCTLKPLNVPCNNFVSNAVIFAQKAAPKTTAASQKPAATQKPAPTQKPRTTTIAADSTTTAADSTTVAADTTTTTMGTAYVVPILPSDINVSFPTITAIPFRPSPITTMPLVNNTTANTLSNHEQSVANGLPVPVVIGIAAGGAVLVMLLISLVVWLVLRRKTWSSLEDKYLIQGDDDTDSGQSMSRQSDYTLYSEKRGMRGNYEKSTALSESGYSNHHRHHHHNHHGRDPHPHNGNHRFDGYFDEDRRVAAGMAPAAAITRHWRDSPPSQRSRGSPPLFPIASRPTTPGSVSSSSQSLLSQSQQSPVPQLSRMRTREQDRVGSGSASPTFSVMTQRERTVRGPPDVIPPVPPIPQIAANGMYALNGETLQQVQQRYQQQHPQHGFTNSLSSQPLPHQQQQQQPTLLSSSYLPQSSPAPSSTSTFGLSGGFGQMHAAANKKSLVSSPSSIMRITQPETPNEFTPRSMYVPGLPADSGSGSSSSSSSGSGFGSGSDSGFGSGSGSKSGTSSSVSIVNGSKTPRLKSNFKQPSIVDAASITRLHRPPYAIAPSLLGSSNSALGSMTPRTTYSDATSAAFIDLIPVEETPKITHAMLRQVMSASASTYAMPLSPTMSTSTSALWKGKGRKIEEEADDDGEREYFKLYGREHQMGGNTMRIFANKASDEVDDNEIRYL